MSNSNSLFLKYAPKEVVDKIHLYDSVAQMWEEVKDIYAENTFLATFEKRCTYKEMDHEVALFRTTLLNNGLNKGDVVGIYAPNTIEFVKAFLAMETLGIVAVLLPPHLPEQALFGLGMKFQMKAIVYHPALQSKIDALKAMPTKMALINVMENGATESTPNKVEQKDPAAVLFTGGTTGKSKGALLNHRALARGAYNGCFGYENVFEQRYLLVLPLTHVFGLVRNLLATIQTGSGLFITANNKDMFRDIAIFKPTIMVMVPALAEMCLNLSKQFGKNMLGPDMLYIICGASTVPPYLVKEYEKYNISLFPGYGLTESANLVSGNPESKNKPASVGYAYEGQTLKIVDGELWLKGDNIMDCYLNDPEENALAFSEDGYFKTGDLVKIDEEGMLYIVGRVKEIIVLSTGEKVSPFDLENKFNEIDVIQDSMVYLEEETGKLCVMVYPRLIELNKVNVEDKEVYLREEINKINLTLPAFERISKIVIRKEDFKRTPAMKILRGKANL